MDFSTYAYADFEFYQFIVESFSHVIGRMIAVHDGRKPKVLIVRRLENRLLDIRIGVWRLRMPKLRMLTFVHGGAIGVHQKKSLKRF